MFHDQALTYLGKNMISEEDVEFVRISLLLLKGGGLIANETLKKNIKNSGQPIDVLLNSFQHKLKHQFNKKQFDKLIPKVGHTNIEEWDIQMITAVLLTVFKSSLTTEEKDAISSIKYVRNEIYAHKSATSSLSLHLYEDIRKELVDAITTISSKMDETEKNNITCLIEECIEWPTKPCNVETLIQGFFQSEELLDDMIEKLRCYKDEFGIKIDALIEPLRDEIIEDLSKVLRDEEKNINKILVVIGLELTLKGDKNNSELVDKAEIQLLKDFNVAIAKAGNSDQSNVYEAVEKFIRVIRKIKDVKILPAKNECIFMQFVCRSYTGLHSLMLYLESEDFRQHLQNIAMEIEKVEEFKDSSYSFGSRIVPKSLKEIFRAITETESTYARTMKIPVEVRSRDGMDQVKDLFESRETREVINTISNTVSADVGTNITIQPSMTLKDVQVTPEPTSISNILSKIHGDNMHDTDENTEHYSGTNVNPDTSIDNGDNDGTDELFRYLILLKSEPCYSGSDSGVGDSVSQRTSKSVSSVTLSDTHDEDKRSDCDDQPSKKIKLEDRPLTIGQAVNLRQKNEIIVTTVGPFISVVGTNAKNFVTVGIPGHILETAFLPDCKRNAKAIAKNPEDGIFLFEIDDDRDSTLQDKGIDANIKPDKQYLLEGTIVYKIGFSGLTKGMIQGNGTIPGRLTSSKKQEIMYVTSLSGSSGEGFAAAGDAGAAVFCQTEDRWACVGILLGAQKDLHSNEELYVIKNIDDVIEELQNISGKNLCLDHHTMSLQMSKAFELL